MSAEYVLKFDAEKIREMPMVDLAFEVLKASNTPFYYRDLMMEIAKLRGFTQEQIDEVIAQLYTEINIDGRFACVGSNVWGLKRWYPVERSDDGAVAGSAKRPRIINDDDDLDDDDLYGEDEEETTFTTDGDGFDMFDEDREEIFEEGEEAAEVDEEVAIDEEEESEIEEEIDEDSDDEDELEEDEFDDSDDDEEDK